MSGGFQTVVNKQPAPAEAGDFFGVNPRAVVLGGPGQFSAPAPNGVRVGSFVWANTDTGAVSQSFVPGNQIGFLGRLGLSNTIIVNFLAAFAYQVLEGFPLTLYSQGDFWALFPAGATPGQVVYADPTDGHAIAGASGGTNSASGTGSIGAAATGTVGTSAATATSTAASAAITAVTGYISAGDVLTDGTNSATVLNQASGTPGGAGTYNLVAAPTPGPWVAASLTGTSANVDLTAVTGFVSVGDTIAGAGYTTSHITAQLTGTPGGPGLYATDGGQQGDLTSQAFTVTSNVLDLTVLSSGDFGPGDILTGPSGSPTIVSQTSGTPGGVGFYTISGSPIHFAPGSITVGAIATGWFVDSVAAPGELAKISSWG